MSKYSLKSKTAGNILYVVLIANLISVAMFTIAIPVLVWVLPASSLDFLVLLEGGTAIIYLLVLAINIIVFLTWMHQLHRDVRKLIPEYPITPNQAVAKLAVIRLAVV